MDIVTIIGIIAAVVFSIFVIRLAAPKKAEQPPTKKESNQSATISPNDKKRLKLLIEGNMSCGAKNEFFSTKIAGLSYRCSKDDIGGFFGVISHEKNNPYDKKARAVLRLDKKHLGYIPREEQADYIRFEGKRDHIPFIGFIDKGDYVELYGYITLISCTEPKQAIKILSRELTSLACKGLKFLPKELRSEELLDFSESEWRDYLIDLLQSK